MKQKKRRGLHGLIGLSALVLTTILVITGCEKAFDPPKINDWGVKIERPGSQLYIGDEANFRALILGNKDYADLVFNWIISGPIDEAGQGKNFSFTANKVGNYRISLEAIDSKSSESRTDTVSISVTRKEVTIFVAQELGIWKSSKEEVKLDSLKVYFQITAKPGEKLPDFDFDFGDGTSTGREKIDSAQTIIDHVYPGYGPYTYTFRNSDTISGTIIIYEPGTNPDDPNTDPNDPDRDSANYDVNLSEFKDLYHKTNYPDALFAKIDSANKKVIFLISLKAAERSIGKDTELALRGSYGKPENISTWEIYSSGTGKELLVNTEKGRYIKLEIDFIYDILYRGNVQLNWEANNYINAENLTPYYSADPSISGDASFKYTIKYKAGIGSKVFPPEL